MKCFAKIGALRKELEGSPGPVVLVPTMGALHAGHAALVDEAREVAGASGTVVVSIFVNPEQFGQGEDFEAYPRDLGADEILCENHGANIVFAPEPDEMYAPDASVDVVETGLAQGLCGMSRPGHFDGVCKVVLKLFNIVSPQSAVFGKKDYQQLAIIRRMVRDLNLPVDIIGAETVREQDGLAVSSRNCYLSAPEREQASAVRQGLLRCENLFGSGRTEAAALREKFRELLESDAPLGRVDYVEVVDMVTLAPLLLVDRPAVMAVAVFFGKARLIDNIELNL